MLPAIGQAIAPNADSAYDYLPHSVLDVPRRPGDARPAGQRGLAALEAASPYPRNRHALRWNQAAAAGSTRIDGHAPMTIAAAPRAPDLVVAMTGASGAPYAVRLLQVLSRFERTVHLTISPSAVQVLREELGLEVDSRLVQSGVLRRIAPGRLVYHHHQDFNAGDRQRIVSNRRDGHHPVQHEHAGLDRRRDRRPT